MAEACIHCLARKRLRFWRAAIDRALRVRARRRECGVRPAYRRVDSCAGEVEAVGEGVTRFRPGDAIFARLDKHRIGAFAEYALVSEGATAAKPKNLDWAEAARTGFIGGGAFVAHLRLTTRACPRLLSESPAGIFKTGPDR